MRSPEQEPYKDKIEVSLDGRQVFYLFFGGAVIACLVFVLGVMVGRRVEARAHVDRGASTSAARDPLAALDQLDATSRDDLSFRTSLAGGTGATEVDEAVAAIEKEKVKEEAPPKVEAPPPKVEEPKKVEEPVKKPEGGFTLQLNSFKEKGEAETFLAELRDAGYKAFLVEAEVEGKGMFYRVRFGHFESYDEALAGKADFEAKVRKIAYVTRL